MGGAGAEWSLGGMGWGGDRCDITSQKFDLFCSSLFVSL